MSALGFVDIDDTMRRTVLTAAAARARTLPFAGRTIVPLFANHGFGLFLRNLLCSMARLEVENWLVVSMDNRTCVDPRNLRVGMREPHACVFPYAHRPLTSAGGGFASYRSLEFNRLVMQRPLWMHELLLRGYSVLQCDLDVVWLHDPFAAFTTPALRNSDMLFQSEGGHGYNGGFYFARPTNASLTLMHGWLGDLIAQSGSKGFEEQHSLGRSLTRAKRSHSNISFRKLNETEFPNGKIWWQYSQIARKSAAYIIHCNWNKYNKKTRLKRDNLWFLDDDDAFCAAPAVDPMEGGCSHYCVPVRHCEHNKPCLRETSCDRLKGLRFRGPDGQDGWHRAAFERAGCPVPNVSTVAPPRVRNHTASAHHRGRSKKG